MLTPEQHEGLRYQSIERLQAALEYSIAALAEAKQAAEAADSPELRSAALKRVRLCESLIAFDQAAIESKRHENWSGAICARCGIEFSPSLPNCPACGCPDAAQRPV